MQTKTDACVFPPLQAEEVLWFMKTMELWALFWAWSFPEMQKEKAKMVKVDCCAIQQEYCVGESTGLKDVVCLRLGTAGIIWPDFSYYKGFVYQPTAQPTG